MQLAGTTANNKLIRYLTAYSKPLVFAILIVSSICLSFKESIESSTNIHNFQYKSIQYGRALIKRAEIL